jgi:hypothetical protein
VEHFGTAFGHFGTASGHCGTTLTRRSGRIIHVIAEAVAVEMVAVAIAVAMVLCIFRLVVSRVAESQLFIGGEVNTAEVTEEATAVNTIAVATAVAANNINTIQSEQIEWI